MSSYKALYRKYRPKTFNDIFGQDHIVLTLKNMIANNKVGHAFLFAGPRGTGKTSVAQVFARAINTAFSNDINFNPLDIIEIDAASNNGVAEIRNIIDNVKYAPLDSKYKVYIIDEVHMLTKGAFNAFLKTLEEPPKNVVFILATTEPHKIPITILSRTQRFNFRRIDSVVIEKQLREILDKESISYDQESLKFIAKLSNGGLRDAISIADQSSSYGDGKITFESIGQVFGLISTENQIKILNLAFNNEVKELLTLSTQFIENGIDIERLAYFLVDILKDFIVIKKTGNFSLLSIIDKEDIEKIKLDLEFAYDALDILIKLLSDLKFTQLPKQSFELALLNMLKIRDHVEIKENVSPKQKIIVPPKVEEANINTSFEKVHTSESSLEIENSFEISLQTSSIPTKDSSDDAGSSNNEIDTKEIEITSELLQKENEKDVEQNELEQSIINTQPTFADDSPSLLDLDSELEQKEKTEIDHMVSMVNKSEETDLMSIIQNNNEEETLPKGLSLDEIINLLLQTEKPKTARYKRILEGIESYISISPEFSSFVEILKDFKIISAGQNFVLLTTADDFLVNQLRRVREQKKFLTFIKNAFKDVLNVYAITKSEFESSKDEWNRLKAINALPEPTQVQAPAFENKSDVTPAAKLGEEVFGDLLK